MSLSPKQIAEPTKKMRDMVRYVEQDLVTLLQRVRVTGMEIDDALMFVQLFPKAAKARHDFEVCRGRVTMMAYPFAVLQVQNGTNPPNSILAMQGMEPNDLAMYVAADNEFLLGHAGKTFKLDLAKLYPPIPPEQQAAEQTEMKSVLRYLAMSSPEKVARLQGGYVPNDLALVRATKRGFIQHTRVSSEDIKKMEPGTCAAPDGTGGFVVMDLTDAGRAEAGKQQ